MEHGVNGSNVSWYLLFMYAIIKSNIVVLCCPSIIWQFPFRSIVKIIFPRNRELDDRSDSKMLKLFSSHRISR